MPARNGYEVCEYVKTNEQLKHIPVMLLVGSFEPFDEAEARRVGANDILSKPFQSIRSLVDKVTGLLAGGAGRTGQAAEQASAPAEIPTEAAAQAPPIEEREGPTAPLPDLETPPHERLEPAELEITTADTRPLPPETPEHGRFEQVAEPVSTAATIDSKFESSTATEQEMEQQIT